MAHWSLKCESATLKNGSGRDSWCHRATEGSPHLDIATSGNEDIAFRDGGADGAINMLIKGNGNIGIGTTNPRQA